MKGKIKKIIILVTILIGTTIGIWKYQNQKNISRCKEECIYNVDDKVWCYKGFEGSRGWYCMREFPNQEQCIDYCLIDLKK